MPGFVTSVDPESSLVKSVVFLVGIGVLISPEVELKVVLKQSF